MTGRRLVAAGAAALLFGMLIGGSAHAAEQLTIDHVEPGDEAVQLLVSLPAGAEPDLDGIAVAIAGVEAETSAELASESQDVVERTTVLAIDTSNSMRRGGRFVAAQQAAETFLNNVPPDVRVGIVTFDSEVEIALQPSLDREAARSVVDGLELALKTRLNDGVLEAVTLTGDLGQRTIIVLSDGRDTSNTPDEDVSAAITDAGVKVDVVALDQSGPALVPLRAMSDAGNGAVISSDPASLAATFASEADSLARQIQVTAAIPAGIEGDETTIAVTVPAEGGELLTNTYAVIRESGPTLPDLTAPPGGFQVPKTAMYGGVAALGVGLLLLLGGLATVAAPSRGTLMERRISAYGSGAGAATATPHEATPALDQAKGAAASMLRRNKGLEARIEARLEAAGSALKPAEWLLLHSAIALLAGLVGMVLGGGDFLTFLFFLVPAVVLPWMWLGFRKRRRVKAFNSGLADTLQLMAGSLSAGMSLAQSVDTVVREGQDPIAGEFRRVLIENRLGVSVEDALDGVAERLGSVDLAWVVMAVRIQREVGGNLAELLTTVAATLRERDFLRRQVQSLSAEGRLSAYILIALPIGMLIYMLLLRRDYVMPLFTDPLGWMLCALAVVLLAMGMFMMNRIVKVEV